MTIELKDGERLDDLQRNHYRIIQHPEKFCFGMDAVLLSGFAGAKKGEHVLDLGTGTGILPILLSAKTEAKHLTGLEIQEESADMARRSVLLNDLQDRIDPPYMIAEHGLTNPNQYKAIARHEICCTLEDVIAAAARVLKTGGRLYMVHRPFRMAEIIRTMAAFRLEPKRLRMVYPYVDQEPNMLLIEAVRGGKSGMTVEKPLIINEAPGVYTREITELYTF